MNRLNMFKSSLLKSIKTSSKSRSEREDASEREREREREREIERYEEMSEIRVKPYSNTKKADWEIQTLWLKSIKVF